MDRHQALLQQANVLDTEIQELKTKLEEHRLDMKHFGFAIYGQLSVLDVINKLAKIVVDKKPFHQKAVDECRHFMCAYDKNFEALKRQCTLDCFEKGPPKEEFEEEFKSEIIIIEEEQKQEFKSEIIIIEEEQKQEFKSEIIIIRRRTKTGI